MKYLGFDHLVFVVGNAKQAASYYCARFGYTPLAYRGLETGHREIVSHVIRQNDVTLVFKSPLNPSVPTQMYDHLSTHGDGVSDVAFAVEDARACWKYAVDRGAKSVAEPWVEKDEHGEVVMATIRTYGDTTHTFIERKNYKGPFLPNYAPLTADPLNVLLQEKLHKETFTDLKAIDHVVGNQPDMEMVPVAKFYEEKMGFHRFWSVDDSQMHTEYSALRSIVVTDYDEVIKV